MNFGTSMKMVLVEAATVAGAADIESAEVDCKGYEGVCFVTTVGVITAGGVQQLRAQQSDVSGSGYADLVGTAVTIADDDDGQTFWLEIHRPRERYLRVIVDRATQNAVVGEIYAILYGGDGPQVNNVANTITGEIHLSPAEGTP